MAGQVDLDGSQAGSTDGLVLLSEEQVVGEEFAVVDGGAATQTPRLCEFIYASPAFAPSP